MAYRTTNDLADVTKTQQQRRNSADLMSRIHEITHRVIHNPLCAKIHSTLLSSQTFNLFADKHAGLKVETRSTTSSNGGSLTTADTPISSTPRTNSPTSPSCQTSKLSAHVMKTLSTLQLDIYSSPPTNPTPRFLLAQYTLEHASHIPLEDRQDLITYAISLINDLSESNYTPAILMKANLLIAGPPCTHPRPVPRYDEAFTQYLRASDSGSPLAAHYAALLLDHGRVKLRGDGKSMEAAEKLHLEAAKGGHPGSLYRLYEIQISKADSEAARSNAQLAKKLVEDAWVLLEQSAQNATELYPEGLFTLGMNLMQPSALVERVVEKVEQAGLEMVKRAAGLGYKPALKFLESL
ncbi:hypothetical protein HDV05_001023 [Chytridiales sp. JEL 0842]|nr:hypothetical protein HDV05_001023 [Chytridiales sp. JEL 0842]